MRRNLLFLAALLPCLIPVAASAENISPIKLGIEGEHLIRWKGPPLEARPVDDNAPIVLRIANVTPDGDSSIYELRYIGTRAGTFDLRDSLRRVDGRAIAAADLPPIPVAIESILPVNHDGELEDRAVANIAWPWRYRLALWSFVALWAVPLIWLMGRRIFRARPRQAVIVNAPPLTLADQLRPLVEAAIAGRLTTGEQARLERMLIAFWRERLDLAGRPMDEALARLRRHEESAALLVHLDAWLHDRPGRHAVDVAAMLRPYRDHAPLNESDLAASPLYKEASA